MKSHWIRSCVALLICLGMALQAAAARAETGQRFFELGAEAYARGEYDAAIAAFRRSGELTSRPGLLFSLAQAHRRAFEVGGDLVYLDGAIRYYKAYLAQGSESSNVAEAKKFLVQLESSAAQLGEYTPRARLILSASTPDAQVELDGKALDRLPRVESVALGRHVLKVSASGHVTQTREVSLERGDVLSLAFTLAKDTAKLLVRGNTGAEVFVDNKIVGRLPIGQINVPGGTRVIEVRQSGRYTERKTVELNPGQIRTLNVDSEPTIRRIASWVLIGVGGAGVLTSGVLGVLAIKEQEAAKELAIQGDGTYAEFQAKVRARDNLRLGAALSAGAGVALGLGGLASLLLEGPGPVRASKNSADVKLRVLPTAGGHAGLVLNGKF